MSSQFQLRLTSAGRAALADGANIGTNAVRYTKVAIGSGHGPGGAADDGRSALRSERDSAMVMGSTEVAGQIAVCAFITASAAYQVREVGLFGRIGSAGAEALHAYWTDPADVFAAAASGSRVIVAGSLAIGPLAADATLAVDASVTLQSQGLLPSWLLPGPHAVPDSRTLPVTAASSAAGGAVSVAAGAELSIARKAADAGTDGFVERLSTAAWQSGDLPANATRYLRARLTAAGALQLYLQGGSDADTVPDSLTGTPDAAAGGGFASTPFDARVAKIVTGAPASVPEVTKYRLEARPPAGIPAWTNLGDFPLPSAAWGSDNELYETVQASGPLRGGAVDPTGDGDSSHWRRVREPSGPLAAAAAVPAAGTVDKTYVVKRASSANGGGLSFVEAVFRRYVTPGNHSFVVPAGVTRLRCLLVGAGGGGGGGEGYGENEDGSSPPAAGGAGVAGGASRLRQSGSQLVSAAGGAGGARGTGVIPLTPPAPLVPAARGYGAGGAGGYGNPGFGQSAYPSGGPGGNGVVAMQTISVVPGVALEITVGTGGRAGGGGDAGWDQSSWPGSDGGSGGGGFVELVNG